MNKKYFLPLFFIFGFAFFFSFNETQVFAEWTGIEDFESYTVGSSISGGAGGSGWSANWVLNYGVATVENVLAGGLSGKALKMASGGTDDGVTRTVTSQSTGEVEFKLQSSGTTIANTQSISLLEGTANPIICRLGITTPGQWECWNGATTSYEAVGAYSANTAFTVKIKYGHVANKYAISFNGGAYSADKSTNGNFTNIDKFDMQGSASDNIDFWLDDIKDIPPPPTTITGSGTINRLAKFITGTSIDNALFSDDGSNTTLTSGNLFLQVGSLIDSITNGVLNFGTTQATTMNFGRSGQNMIINSKVGIGTNTPTATLHVNGDFFANVINVIANGLGIDTLTAGTLSIGSTTASAINIGRTGVTATVPGTISFGGATTISNCNSTTTPGNCGSAPSGSVALPTGGSTLVVNTTAVTANSQIFITEDSSLGSRLGITCNTGTNRNYSINARTAGTSFTIKSSANPNANKACLNYLIIN